MSSNAKDTNMLVFLALGDAKMLSFALGDAKVPDARYFAFWWNIGLSLNKNIFEENYLVTEKVFIKETNLYQVYHRMYVEIVTQKCMCIKPIFHQEPHSQRKWK